LFDHIVLKLLDFFDLLVVIDVILIPG